MSAAKAKVPPCRDGWNFHVFTLAADRCSCCGWNRYEPHVAAGRAEGETT